MPAWGEGRGKYGEWNRVGTFELTLTPWINPTGEPHPQTYSVMRSLQTQGCPLRNWRLIHWELGWNVSFHRGQVMNLWGTEHFFRGNIWHFSSWFCCVMGGKSWFFFFLIQVLKQIQSCLGASQTFYCDKVQIFQCDCARTCRRDEILYILHLGFVALKYDNEIQKHTEQNEKAQPKQSHFTLLRWNNYDIVKQGKSKYVMLAFLKRNLHSRRSLKIVSKK